MFRHLIGYLVFALSFLAASLAVADADAPLAQAGAVYETVDAIEVSGNQITVTGIISGQNASTELRYLIFDNNSGTATESAARCDRLAMLAMAKPGKYQFVAIMSNAISRFSCKLIVRAP